jgi:tripartite ATP-independent transporter DctP family solute receptor
MKRKSLVMFLAFVLAIACTVTAVGKDKADIVLKLGYSSPTTNPWHICAGHLAEYVNKNTNGKVRIDLFPAEMLGSDKQMAEMVKMGTLDMQIAPQGVVANYEPKLAVLELPFLFDSNEKVAKVLDGPIGKELAKDLPKKGLRVLGYWENGLRHTTNNVRPIEKPSDLKGMKIRTPENKMTISIYKALGANPAPLAYSELYMALSQGVFDGQENPIVNIHASKLYEVQKYLSLTNHKYEGKPFIVSEKVWKKLPANVQKVLAKGAAIYGIENRKMFAEQDGKLLADLKAKGMKVNQPELTPFRNATKSVYDEWQDVFGKSLVTKIIKAATK